MSPGSSTESYPAFSRIGLRENPGKNLNQVTCPDRDSNPGHLVSRPDALTVTPQKSQEKPLQRYVKYILQLIQYAYGNQLCLNRRIYVNMRKAGNIVRGSTCSIGNKKQVALHKLHPPLRDWVVAAGDAAIVTLLADSMLDWLPSPLNYTTMTSNFRPSHCKMFIRHLNEIVRNADYNTFEEVHGLSVTGSTRRIDIIAFKESTRSGYIIDPTVRFETDEEQPAEMDNEKKNIYNPTIPYYLKKYQLKEHEVIGLLVGARGWFTINRKRESERKRKRLFRVHNAEKQVVKAASLEKPLLRRVACDVPLTSHNSRPPLSSVSIVQCRRKGLLKVPYNRRTYNEEVEIVKMERPTPELNLSMDVKKNSICLHLSNAYHSYERTLFSANNLFCVHKVGILKRFVCNCGRHLQWSGIRGRKTLLGVPEATDHVARKSKENWEDKFKSIAASFIVYRRSNVYVPLENFNDEKYCKDSKDFVEYAVKEADSVLQSSNFKRQNKIIFYFHDFGQNAESEIVGILINGSLPPPHKPAIGPYPEQD
ncbi:hypothetical protein ANN_16059 [Periplaneta americana]|uniref:Uncharacterized protein n=1 Tax=Periplaneta americana TaxID=6978 RepID=A0ABQ8SJA5_PERAM|nr:hypothetical protein ANN_16059 [Periplaneta americana]